MVWTHLIPSALLSFIDMVEGLGSRVYMWVCSLQEEHLQMLLLLGLLLLLTFMIGPVRVPVLV